MAKKPKAGTSKAAAKKRLALFVNYVVDPRFAGNATKAAIEAGYGKKSARRIATRLLARPEVKAAVEERRQAMVAAVQESTDLTAEEVMRSLARDLRFDPAKMLDAQGNLLPISMMDEDTRLALRGMEHYAEFIGRGEDRERVGTTSKVKFPEKTAAREQAMKHFGLYEADNRQKPAPSVAIGILTVRPSDEQFAAVAARAAQRSA